MALTTEQTDRYNYLKNLVAQRFDEFIEGDSPTDIPIGNLENELTNACRSIVKRAHRNAVLQIGKQASSPTLIQMEARGSTVIPVPSDYLRFLQVAGKEWGEPATYTVPNNSQVYRDQKYTMKRATKADPLVALIPYYSSSVNEAFELFPAIEELDSQGLIYVPDIGPYDLPVEFEDALTWRATAQLLVIGQRPGADAVFSLSNNALQEIGLDEPEAG